MFSVQNTSTHGKVLVYSEVLSSSEHTSPSLGIIHTVLNAQVLLCSSLQKQLIVSNEWKHFEQWSYKKDKRTVLASQDSLWKLYEGHNAFVE